MPGGSIRHVFVLQYAVVLGYNRTVYANLLERQKLEDTVNLACLGIAITILALLVQFFVKFKAEKGIGKILS